MQNVISEGWQLKSRQLSILLTGANAFIGRRVADRISHSDHHLLALTRKRYSDDFSGVGRVVKCDLSIRESLRCLDDTRVDCIVHVAATSPKPGVTLSDMIRDNVVATMNLVDWARTQNVKRVIFVSSVSIYGAVSVPEVSSTTEIINPGSYGITKRLGEIMLREAEEKIASISIRLPGVVGPRASRIWLSRVAHRLAKNEDISIFNPHAPFNNAIHVEDLADFILHLLTEEFSGAASFPIGAEGTLKIRDVVATLKESLQSRSNIQISEIDSHSFTINNDVAKGYGYVPANISVILQRYAQDIACQYAS